MLLAGVDWYGLDLRDSLDVAYAALVEAETHGAWVSVETVLTHWDEALVEALPDRETFGTSQAAQRGQEATERVFGQARPRAPKAPTMPEE